MKILILFFLKLSAQRVPLIVMIVACQLVLGQISSTALGERPLKLSFAIDVQGAGEYSRRFERDMMASPDFTVISIGPDETEQEVFEKGTVQCLVRAPEYFDERIRNGEDGAVTIIPAPGIANLSAINEYIAAEIISIRSGILLSDALNQLNVPKRDIDEQVGSSFPLIVPEYDGPPTEGLPFETPPRYGVPALFLLLAFLLAAQNTPGIDNRRIVLAGRRAMRRSYLYGSLSMLLLWAAAVSLYVLCMKLLYDVALPISVLFALLMAAWYAGSLGGVLAATGKRNLAAAFFVPWLLVNMTLGGGLWSNAPLSPALAPLLPVSAVVGAANGGVETFAPLIAATGAALIAGLLIGLSAAPATVGKPGFRPVPAGN
jgi:hypothetical protein